MGVRIPPALLRKLEVGNRRSEYKKRAHDVAAAYGLAKAEVWVRLPLGALRGSEKFTVYRVQLARNCTLHTAHCTLPTPAHWSSQEWTLPCHGKDTGSNPVWVAYFSFGEVHSGILRTGDLPLKQVVRVRISLPDYDN